MIGVEDPGNAATPQGHLQGLQTEFRVKVVRKLPAEDVPGVKIDDDHQAEEALPQRNVDGICCPDLIWCFDLFQVDKTREAFLQIAGNGGPGFRVESP